MSVIVKGMDAPKCCDDCKYNSSFADREWCDFFGYPIDITVDMSNERQKDCPFIPLPEKHGQLIDKAEYCLRNGCQPPYNDMDCANCIICDCKVILESEATNE